jgi:CheY-like chemotaxis protein
MRGEEDREIQRTEATVVDLLLIEDRAADAELIAGLLAGPGWHVERCADLAEGLDGLARRGRDGRRPDCVLLDLKLPDAIGLQALFALSD